MTLTASAILLEVFPSVYTAPGVRVIECAVQGGMQLRTHRRTEAAGRALAAGGRAVQCGGGWASVGEGRTGGQRRTANNGDRDEHGVAGASDAIVGAASIISAGDTV